MARIPLAWKNLTHSLPRLLVALAGVSFAVVLMFMQTGFRNALFDSTVQPIKELDADLVVVSRARFSLTRASRFPLTQLLSLATIDGVGSVRPLYMEMAAAMVRTGRRQGRPIRVLGFDPDDCPLTNREVLQQLPLLRRPQTALVDRRTKPAFGLDWRRIEAGTPQAAELNNVSLEVAGAFDLAADFANEGTLAMSSDNFARYFPFRGDYDPLSVVDLGLIRVAEGQEIRDVLKRLAEQLPDSLQAYTRDEFQRREVKFWARSTPIGIIFAVGTVMGFVVGVIMCYQVIYTDISDHMAEFATLKAMGYTPRYFAGLVISEAVYLSLLGFIPGLLVSWALFGGIAAATGLLMRMTVLRAALVLLLTLIMCVISGAIAMRRLLTADPASLF